jgi:hypothetical protein
MGWPLKSMEWRKLPESNTWHFFIKNNSVCGRLTTNGHFDFLENKPTDEQMKSTCKMCLKEGVKIKERLNEIIKV